MKFKTLITNFIVFIFLFILADVVFSNFIFKRSVDNKCYEHIDEGRFYRLRKNCFANMRFVSTVDSYKVYTDQNGIRYSGKKRILKNQNLVFLGDSSTFGLGVDWKDTFSGIIEKKFPEYNIYNLGMPSYSPTVYKFILEEFIKTNKIKINKVFVFIDLTDVSDEGTRWIIHNGKPSLTTKKIVQKSSSKFSKFKKENFKGAYFAASKIRSFFRNLKKKSDKNNIKKTNLTDGTFVGGFLYTNHKKLSGCYEETQENQFWKCEGVDKGLKKIEKKITEISEIVKSIDSELYLITAPWPDTLTFGQTVFNWEDFNKRLCLENNCDGLISMFPIFNKIKDNENNWLENIYLKHDVHFTPRGNKLFAEEIIKKAFQ